MSAIVRSEVTETGFGFYTDDDIKNLSVMRIVSPVSQDLLGNNLEGGLYDPHLGPTEVASMCVTCSKSYVQCPGHIGHIELDVPIYSPLLFTAMFQLLRSKCMYCHKLRVSSTRVRHTLIKLKLLELGNISQYESFDELLTVPVVFDDLETNHASDLESKLCEYERQYAQMMTANHEIRKFNAKTTAHHHKKLIKQDDVTYKTIQRSVIDNFFKTATAMKKCENCGAYSPAFRKDGFSKIFQKALPKRTQKIMRSMRKVLKTGLESLQEEAGENHPEDIADNDSDEDDDEEEDDDVAEMETRKDGKRVVKIIDVADNDKYLVPWETEAQMQLLWRFNAPLLDFIWGRSLAGVKGGRLPRLKAEDINNPNINSGWKIFFSRIILVAPNRFRPASKLGDSSSDHPQNAHLSRILESNEKIRRIQVANSIALSNAEDDVEVTPGVVMPAGGHLSKLVSAWIELQDYVNCYLDSDKDPNPLGTNGAPSGIRQLLERKEGLFRKHMMGKRVNYCCRSVISPDPYLGTNEIGIPVQFAKVLHYPTPVNDFNIRYLRTLVERGPDQYPGANQIETADGKITKLEKLSAHERAGRARLLGTQPGAKVYRHLINGDVLLVNRQPTLHKPGIMAHKARVLTHVKEQTLRMNYANCNSYNADFDGDEMNCHFVQNDIARAEATYIMNTDNQYIVPTSGNPLRGLIQDHVASGVKMTCKDTFLTKTEFQQLLYVAVCGLPGTEIVTAMELMITPAPAIYKPKMLWTGKQVVSSLLKHMCRPPLPQLNLDGKTRTPPTALGAEHNEHIIVFRFGELLCGVIDKASIGNSSLGIIHAVYELYGAELAGRLLSAFGRLFTYFLQGAGHTCGIADLTLTRSAEEERRRLLEKVKTDAQYGLDAFLSNTSVAEGVIAGTLPFTDAQNQHSEERSRLLLMTSVDKRDARVRLDAAMQAVINKSASDVIKVCIPTGLSMPFLKNNFSMMVLTGAKGSAVNQSQISCFLGQQALEGQRVPTMISGKSLPSFRAYDCSARSGGFVQDRFLTGVKPQEYYFHCMAGREGLVDTAVKTSRSGYLQRCLVKHLEELKVNYDMTVRDSAGTVIQFLYGEDGLDPTMASLLGGKPNQMQFLARNHQAVSHKYSMHEGLFTHGVNYELAVEHHERMKQAKKMITKGALGLKKGGVILARRKWRVDSAWSRGNVKQTWFPAEILKIRPGATDEKDSYDLLYFDGVVEKKVPKGIYAQPRKSTTEGGSEGLRCDHPIFVPLVKVGLFDTAMSSLALGSCIGACSEKLQDSIQTYIKENPDGAVSSVMTESTVTAMALELLVWMKYMRSLACPGEAVGCVAAQSVGEPSTQMTLNTFHLAGHGGANVTLGIPRLREIIMTASKNLKTPTMFIPLAPGTPMSVAKEAARTLTRLPLVSLLKHTGGVQVGESIVHATDGVWKRVYRIRLMFEDPVKIKECFGVDFNTIKKVCTEGLFHTKLVHMIMLEQRRSGEKASANKSNLISSFKAKKGGGEAEFNDSDEPDNEVKKRKDKEGKNLDKMMEDEEEEEEEEENEEDGKTQVGSKKEIDGYEEESDDEAGEELDGENGKENIGSDSDSDDDKENKKKKSTDSDDDSDEETAPQKSSSSSAKTAPASSSSSSSSFKTPSKKSSRVSFGTGLVGMTSHATTPYSKSSLGLGGEVGYDEEEGWVEMLLSYPATSRRLLMVQLVEQAAAVSTIRATKDIQAAYAVPFDVNGVEGVALQTEGVNFEAIWAMSSKLVQANQIKCNDIWRMLTTFGIESARASIVTEVQAVFGVYGIDVNARHLSLIADFMTRTGSYLPMSRLGMNDCASPFLQMSFETTSLFLTKAASEGAIDMQESPSARIVLGSIAKVGTGCFDIMLPLGNTN